MMQSRKWVGAGALVIVACVSCGTTATGTVAQPANSSASFTATTKESSPTFDSDLEWRKYVQSEIPTAASWADDRVVPIAKAFCRDFDKQPRVTDSVIDDAMFVLMDGGPSKMNRDDAETFLTLTVSQFCPTYVEELNEYYE